MTPPFLRTKCACADCVECCKTQPGPLIPGDFERIAERLGETREEAKRHFWASPGAIVGTTDGSETFRVGTITPRRENGRCVFLDENDRCKIHGVAPAGCSHFDTHLNRKESMKRSLWCIRAQAGSAEYQELRSELPAATSYEPKAY